MTPLELLAPAKNLECGKAAIDHGADAVYIGADHFGARAAAGNSVADIEELCSYAHQFAAKVYVTVNTIIYDDELDATRQLINDLADAGVDAVLIQDMGVLNMVKQTPMDAHASTQTDNRSADKVAWLHSLGFSRVVLARELSVDEISAIHQAVPDVALEVFVHGALCVSYSGVCYASQYCFGRSANRGECAQFCRLKFKLEDADGEPLVNDSHLLSLKDMNQSEHLAELIQAGATSFKIEGRLKDATYVKNVTAAYSQRLDEFIRQHADAYCRASLGHCKYSFTPNLNKTFNRGFTNYFLKGRQPDIASFDTPKALGEYVGKVKEIRGNSFNVAGVATFANGDGLCFLNGERELEGFRVNRVEGNRLFPLQMPANLHPGLALYRNNDQEFERVLSRPSSVRKIPVTIFFAENPAGYQAVAEIEIPQGICKSTAIIGCEHQKAERPQKENIIRQLSKLGNTPFEAVGVKVADDFDQFIPSSILSELRRNLVEKMLSQINVAMSASDSQNADYTHFSMQQPASEQKTEHIRMPHYPQPSYCMNISNGEAAEFYEEVTGKPTTKAFELQQPKGDKLLMQCRHCLRYSLGYCVKRGGKIPQWHEPLRLTLPDGRRFRLQFDCAHCQMNIFAEES